MAILASFEEEELDRDFSEVAKVITAFETGVVGNGKAVGQRHVNRYDGLERYEIFYGSMSPARQTRLREFFRTKWGRAIGFRFFPPFDREFDRDIIGVGDGATTEFFLQRNYISRTRFYTRRITKPIHPELCVTVSQQKVIIADPDGDIVPEGPYPILDNPITVDWNTGKITFTDAPANGAIILAVSGEYDVPVYFESDAMGADDYGSFANTDTIRLVEILPAQITDEGNDLPAISLGFVTPLSNSAVPEQFDVSFTSDNVTYVEIYVNGVYAGSTSSGPSFAFANVARPTTDTGYFDVEARGLNTTGGFTVARITLRTLPAELEGDEVLLLDDEGNPILDDNGNLITK